MKKFLIQKNFTIKGYNDKKSLKKEIRKVLGKNSKNISLMKKLLNDENINDQESEQTLKKLRHHFLKLFKDFDLKIDQK